ncbi:MAG: hypothetical protein U0168_17245 [Nannocystaceae bacterium]
MRTKPFVVLALLTACSGAGVSTTARTSGDSVGDTDASAGDAASVGDDAGDDAGEGAVDSGGLDSAADTSDTAVDGGADAGSDSGGADDTAAQPVTLEGAWLSEGDDIAPLLVELTGATSITATFGPQAFTVVTIDDQGQQVQQVGVYTATPSGVGEIFDITLEQTMPQAITVEGIFEIDDSVSPAVLRYEVVQTEPSVGAVAPTAEAGFGATSLGPDLTQVFVRQ